jgi:hypothetical protein
LVGKEEASFALGLAAHREATLPQRSNELQRIVLAIHHQLAGRALVAESQMLRDRSTGQEREVDIVIKGTAAGHPFLLSIECCDSGRRATVEWVERMVGKHANLPTDKLILVSRAGFTGPAERKARYEGAEPLSLKEADAVEWTSVVHRLNSLIFDAALARSIVMPGFDVDPLATERALGRDQVVYSADGKSAVRVGEFEEFVLTNPTLRSHTLDTVEAGDDGGWIVGLPLAKGAYTLDEAGELRILDAISVVVTIKRRHLPIQLRSALFRGFQVAYGEATGELGTATVAVLEREGLSPTAVILHSYGGLQEVAHFPASGTPALQPASLQAIKALIGELEPSED